ncbi:hypothetical protein MMC18_001555 [Xylographa bjoerkii]|nr:hypothetical protein [Xylographa bjoerkii]
MLCLKFAFSHVLPAVFNVVSVFKVDTGIFGATTVANVTSTTAAAFGMLLNPASSSKCIVDEQNLAYLFSTFDSSNPVAIELSHNLGFAAVIAMIQVVGVVILQNRHGIASLVRRLKFADIMVHDTARPDDLRDKVENILNQLDQKQEQLSTVRHEFKDNGKKSSESLHETLSELGGHIDRLCKLLHAMCIPPNESQKCSKQWSLNRIAAMSPSRLHQRTADWWKHQGRNRELMEKAVTVVVGLGVLGGSTQGVRDDLQALPDYVVDNVISGLKLVADAINPNVDKKRMRQTTRYTWAQSLVSLPLVLVDQKLDFTSSTHGKAVASVLLALANHVFADLMADVGEKDNFKHVESDTARRRGDSKCRDQSAFQNGSETRTKTGRCANVAAEYVGWRGTVRDTRS